MSDPIDVDERWLPIPGCDGYEASSQGRIRSYLKIRRLRSGYGSERVIGDTPMLIRLHKNRFGRVHCSIRRAGRMVTCDVHPLILLAFVGPCPPEMECRHGDDDPSNNCISNLCWGTRLENVADRHRNGITPAGSNNGGAKLTDDQVTEIIALHGTVKNGDLAKRFGVCKGTIERITGGRKWMRHPAVIALNARKAAESLAAD